MPTDSRTVREILLAKFEALLAECDLVADQSAFGQPLDDMDEFFLIRGHKFLQETFEANGKYPLKFDTPQGIWVKQGGHFSH